jgi:hypothetical protein
MTKGEATKAKTEIAAVKIPLSIFDKKALL